MSLLDRTLMRVTGLLMIINFGVALVLFVVGSPLSLANLFAGCVCGGVSFYTWKAHHGAAQSS